MRKSLFFALILTMMYGCSSSDEGNPSEQQNQNENETPGNENETPKAECNGVNLDQTEVCDGLLGVPETCAALDSSKVWAPGGRPACSSTCDAIELGTCREIQCGDGFVDAPEVCDGTLDVPATCSEWDDSKVWAPGGQPACSSTCDAILAGSCHTVDCGDGFVDAPEVCDGELGVPATCSEWDSSRAWLPGGKPECAADCRSVDVSSCKPAPRQLDVMNWNVLFEYDAWGGSLVLPRAQILHDILAQYETKPDFISMVEASKQWHHDDVNALLADLGYAWADTSVPNEEQDSDYYMTQVIYQTDRFEVVENDSVTLYPYTAAGDKRNKCISFASVMREKATGAEFIIMSTHWDPNIESNTCTYKSNIAGPIIMRETNRVKGVAQTVELINRLREKYPKAHIFYGGDLNTIDFQLIFDSPTISSIVGSNMSKLILFANALYLDSNNKPCGNPFPEDFVGSFDSFVATSGLLSARDQAIETGVAKNDISSINQVSTEADGMGDKIKLIIDELVQVKLIIDYAFYSPDMTLLEYEVMNDDDGDDDYARISDHYPIRTRYTYNLDN